MLAIRCIIILCITKKEKSLICKIAIYFKKNMDFRSYKVKKYNASMKHHIIGASHRD